MRNASITLFKLSALFISIGIFTSYTDKALDVKITFIAEPIEIPVVKAMTIETESDLNHLWRIGVSESLNQSYQGIAAVQQCVIDRAANPEFKERTIFEVISKPGQFDSYNNSYYNMTRRSFKNHKETIRKTQVCKQAAYDVLVKGYRPVPGYIMFFLNPCTATDKRFINWLKRQNYSVMSIEDHDFYYIPYKA